MVRQSELEQPAGCVETSPAGGRLGIPFHHRTEAYHICHQAEALLCNNEPCTPFPPINKAQIEVTVHLKQIFKQPGDSWELILHLEV